MDKTLIYSCLIWGGILLIAFGALNVLVPFRFLGLRTRRAGIGLGILGMAAIFLGFVAPGAAARTERTGQMLDAYVTTYHFRDYHWERIHASPNQIHAAIRAVTAPEIRGYQAVMWMNSPRRALSPGEKQLLKRPLLELMTRADFVILAERRGREIVVGTIGQFWAGRSAPIRNPREFRAFSDPRYAKVAMNFHIRDEGNGWCKVTTETRVACPDPAARARFDAYWRTIYPGGSVLRVQWLQAIKRRAERARVVGTPET